MFASNIKVIVCRMLSTLRENVLKQFALMIDSKDLVKSERFITKSILSCTIRSVQHNDGRKQMMSSKILNFG